MNAMNEQHIDAMVDLIAHRVADIVWKEIEQRLDNKEDSKLISRKDVMQQLGICEATLFRWEKTGQLQRAATIGRKVFYDLSKLKQLKNS